MNGDNTPDLIVVGASAGTITMESNTTLDCNGFKIIGPSIPYNPDDPSAEEYHGIYAQKRTKVRVKNCRVEKYTRGLHFDEVTRLVPA